MSGCACHSSSGVSDARKVSGALREVRSVPGPQNPTVGVEPLICDLKQPDGGTPNKHWVVEQLTFLGTMTGTVPGPQDVLSGLFLCPPQTPLETLTQAQAGVNLNARPFLLPTVRLAGASTQGVIAVTSPAAGAEVIYAVLQDMILTSVTALYNPDATGGPRTVNLLIGIPSVPTVVGAFPLNGQPQPADVNDRLSWYPGGGIGVGAAPIFSGPLTPGMIVRAGWVISTLTTGLGPADQYSSVQIVGTALNVGTSGLDLMWALDAKERIIVPQNWFLRAIVTPTPGTLLPGPGAGSKGLLTGLVTEQWNAGFP